MSETTNETRGERGARLMLVYTQSSDADYRDGSAITDAIADLLHFAGQSGTEEPETVHRLAWTHYEAERVEGKQLPDTFENAEAVAELLGPAPEPRDRCTVCDRELDEDDHWAREHRGGYAHEACIDAETQNA